MFFRKNKKPELEIMVDKHNFELQKMRLTSELEIEKEKLSNELTLNKLYAENDQLSIKQQIFKLKNENKRDEMTIKAGKKLKFWAVLVTLIST